jgi:hypothetical protein
MYSVYKVDYRERPAPKIGFQHNFEGSKQRAYIYQLNIFKLLEAGYDFEISWLENFLSFLPFLHTFKRIYVIENCYQKRKKNMKCKKSHYHNNVA